MLYPRLQTVSTKGQIVLPVDMRKLFGITAGSSVAVIPNIQKQQIVIQSLVSGDPIEAGYGVLAGNKASLVKNLMEIRKKERILEKKKYGRIRS